MHNLRLHAAYEFFTIRQFIAENIKFQNKIHTSVKQCVKIY